MAWRPVCTRGEICHVSAVRPNLKHRWMLHVPRSLWDLAVAQNDTPTNGVYFCFGLFKAAIWEVFLGTLSHVQRELSGISEEDFCVQTGLAYNLVSFCFILHPGEYALECTMQRAHHEFADTLNESVEEKRLESDYLKLKNACGLKHLCVNLYRGIGYPKGPK